METRLDTNNAVTMKGTMHAIVIPRIAECIAF